MITKRFLPSANLHRHVLKLPAFSPGRIASAGREWPGLDTAISREEKI